MDMKRCSLLGLPDSIVDRIIQLLDPFDVKNLSLSCCELLSRIEDVPNMVPRLHVISIDSASKYDKETRILPETYPGSYTVHADKQSSLVQQQIISRSSIPSSPPAYHEAQMAKRSRNFRLHKRSSTMEREVWLCPHRGCTPAEIVHLTQQNPSLLSTIHDTVPALCPFPKCTLWARHALISSHKAPSTYELCSAIRIYRCPCSTFEEVQTRLRSEKFRLQVFKATRKLSMWICSHSQISSLWVSDTFSPKDICLLHASEIFVEHERVPMIRKAFDQYHCQCCVIYGTYTTWGFIARYTHESGRFWLDIEMLLCRPMFDYGTLNIGKSPHWMHHSGYSWDARLYGKYWWWWAKIVANDGFDWRAPLPPGFLKYPSKGLLDFPPKILNSCDQAVHGT